jgi:hypothetical protein
LICAVANGDETSTTCRSNELSLISSSVARNAATRFVGKRWMKPTVSVARAVFPSGSEIRRVVGSSVAKSLSSANTVFLPFVANEPA